MTNDRDIPLTKDRGIPLTNDRGVSLSTNTALALQKGVNVPFVDGNLGVLYQLKKVISTDS